MREIEAGTSWCKHDAGKSQRTSRTESQGWGREEW